MMLIMSLLPTAPFSGGNPSCGTKHCARRIRTFVYNIGRAEVAAGSAIRRIGDRIIVENLFKRKQCASLDVLSEKMPRTITNLTSPEPNRPDISVP